MTATVRPDAARAASCAAGIDAAGESGDDGESCRGELVGEFSGDVSAVGGGAAGADDADGVFVGRSQISPEVEEEGVVV